MTHKTITLKFVVLTGLGVALGVLISVGAVHLKDNYLTINQAEANHSVTGSGGNRCCQSRTGGFRAFTCCFPI